MFQTLKIAVIMRAELLAAGGAMGSRLLIATVYDRTGIEERAIEKFIDQGLGRLLARTANKSGYVTLGILDAEVWKQGILSDLADLQLALNDTRKLLGE